MKQFRGRVAAVTGAASGIGHATALRLADEGCALALIDLDEARLEDVNMEVEGRGVRATCHVADVSDATRMEALPGS